MHSIGFPSLEICIHRLCIDVAIYSILKETEHRCSRQEKRVFLQSIVHISVLMRSDGHIIIWRWLTRKCHFDKGHPLLTLASCGSSQDLGSRLFHCKSCWYTWDISPLLQFFSKSCTCYLPDLDNSTLFNQIIISNQGSTTINFNLALTFWPGIFLKWFP